MDDSPGMPVDHSRPTSCQYPSISGNQSLRNHQPPTSQIMVKNEGHKHHREALEASLPALFSEFVGDNSNAIMKLLQILS